MPRLLHDRYVLYDDIHGCDLATGDEVRLDALPKDGPSDNPPALVELLNNGRDGSPRWVAYDVRNRAQAAVVARRLAGAARDRGFVPILVSLYERFRDALAADLDERTLLLIGGAAGSSPRLRAYASQTVEPDLTVDTVERSNMCWGGQGGKELAAARAALVDAAARAPRPHVLLTFRTTAAIESGCTVREARVAYGPQPLRQSAGTAVPSAEVVRHVERAARAAEFQRAGRHAAAERLLRDVAGTLSRREAWSAAARVLIALARLLLERGRASAADKVLSDAVRFAESDEDEGLALDARIWQALARSDAGRLTEAESICRAVLLATSLSPMRHMWARAVLARVLCWQERTDEALRCQPASSGDPPFDGDLVVAASIRATSVRVLLACGDVFQAGLHARALMDGVSDAADPLVRVVATTSHLRVLAAAGDLHLAEHAFESVRTTVRQCHAPWRAVRARLIWLDALRRAGRTREAQRQLDRLMRLGRIAPALLRRAIERRLAAGGQPSDRVHVTNGFAGATSAGAALVHLAHEDEHDREALQRVLDRASRELNPSRIELVSADAGPPSVLVSVGAGLPTHIGQRVLEAGIVLESDVGHGAREIGTPVRLGVRLLGALVCRWPLDREPPPQATNLLALVSAIVAPRVEALIAGVREASIATTAVPELIGVSAAMSEVRRAIGRAARAPFSVMIEGESGAGKELAARAIHHLSARRERRFCDVNCAALPDDLLESELFGHAKGAFTGAVADKAGLFEEADGGTLFLDEVPDLSPRAQAKLLRAVQQQDVRRIGETFTRKVDVRLIAAANRDMRAEAAAKRFRADLLFRLDVIHLRLPPLRERPEDIPLLAQHYWRIAAERVGSRASLTHAVLTELSRYPWPGNVRELQNVLAALAVAAPARGRVSASLLPPAISRAAVVTTVRLADARTQFERRCVEVALARAGGSRTRAAAELGLTRQGLLKTMARLGIDASNVRDADASGSGSDVV
jgi:DNA-binding NtrC family response regulator